MRLKFKSEGKERLRTIENIQGQSTHKKSSHQTLKSQSHSVLKNSFNLVGDKNGNKLSRSKVLSVSTIKPSTIAKLQKISPYDKFVKDLNIKLPTPKDKFIEFLEIPPFNRLRNHIEFISHILQKSYYFFQKHPKEVVENASKKILKIDPQSIPTNYIVIVDEGTAFYEGKLIERGRLITRKSFNPREFSYDEGTQLIGLPKHEYNSAVSNYLTQNLTEFKRFLGGLQIFKIFSEESLSKIFSTLNLHFLIKGESLYNPGEQASELFVLYEGKVVRKVIVQIDQTNKIPLQGFSKLVKVLSKSYEHKIQFNREDLVGVSEIVQNLSHHTEEIKVEEDCTVISMDRAVLEENLDEYILDRLKKYNYKKYPKNYDELCDKYLKQKLENRKAEERKIAALRDQINKSQNGKKNEKIESIIKIYQERIKIQNRENLLFSKNIERKVFTNES